MSGHDAFEGEQMHNDVDNFLLALRTEIAEQPDPRLEADLVTGMAAIARAESVTGELAPATRPRRRFAALRRAALPARIALVCLGLVLSMAGLAVAGVKLPGPIDSTFSKLGIELPNQDAGDGGGPATEPGGAPSQGSPGDNGSAEPNPNAGKGKGKSKGKSKAHSPSGNANGHQGSGSPGNSGDAPGRTKATGTKQSSPAKPGSRFRGVKPAAPKPEKRLKPVRSGRAGLSVG